MKTVTDHKYISEACHEEGCQYLVLTESAGAITLPPETKVPGNGMLRITGDPLTFTSPPSASLGVL